MTKQLYEEALADVKKLKEVAEDNAKRALLEAVTPRIRDLIENQLLGELGEIEADEDKLLMDEPELESEHEHVASCDTEIPVSVSTVPMTPSVQQVAPVNPVPAVGSTESAALAISMPDQEGKVTLDLDSLKVPDSEEYELSTESVEALGLLRNTVSNVNEDFNKKLKDLQKKINLLSNAGKLVRETKSYSEILSATISEAEDMYAHLQSNMSDSKSKQVYESALKNCHLTLRKLTEQKMKNKKNALNEEDVTLKLTGLPDDVDLDSVGVDLITGDEEADEAPEGDEGEEDLDLDLDEEGEEESEEDMDSDEEDEDMEEAEAQLTDETVVEIDENMLRKEIARMKALREENETKVQSWGHGPGDVSSEEDFEDDDLGDPFTDVELTTEGEEEDSDDEEKKMDEQDQSQMDEQDQDELDELDQAYMDQAQDDRKHGGNVAPESMGPGAETNKQKRHTESLDKKLETEMAIQSEAKQKAQKAKKMQKEAQKKKDAKKAKKMQEAYNFFAKKFNESVARSNKLKSMLAEAAKKDVVKNEASTRSAEETSTLRAKLAETNLFNAKLLFTNKLLQNESLTKRQKAEVIERLDEAKTEREVKLVYESLTKTLQGSTKLTESTTRGVVGSASRPTRPASTTTLNEGYEADRWARLAGIVK